jgi:hypothetical protein
MPGQPSIMLLTLKAVCLPMTGGSADITPPYGSEAALIAHPVPCQLGLRTVRPGRIGPAW